MTHDYWTKFGNSCQSDRSSNSIWLNALLHLLTHNDFYPALVGEQTLTRSVILHNNYQEKRKTSFVIEIVFFRKSAMGYVFTQLQLENRLLQDQLYYIITTKKKKTSFTKGGIMSEKCQRLKNVFLITLLNYSIQYMTLTNCQFSISLHLQV